MARSRLSELGAGPFALQDKAHPIHDFTHSLAVEHPDLVTQNPLVKRNHPRDVHDALLREIPFAGNQQNVAGVIRPPENRGQFANHGRMYGAPIEVVTLDHHDIMRETGLRTCGRSKVGVVDVALANCYSSSRRLKCSLVSSRNSRSSGSKWSLW